MATQGDVKAVQVTATGTIFGGRTRLRGLVLSNTTTTTDTGSISLSDTAGVQFTADVPPGDVFSFNFPSDGILFEGGISCNAITSSKCTVLLDK
jgi:hypothetical protein